MTNPIKRYRYLIVSLKLIALIDNNNGIDSKKNDRVKIIDKLKSNISNLSSYILPTAKIDVATRR